MSDPNQIYELEGRLFKFGILDRGEIERFAETFYKGPGFDGADRAQTGRAGAAGGCPF